MKKPELYMVTDLALKFNISPAAMRLQLSKIDIKPYCSISRYPVYDLQEVKDKISEYNNGDYVKRREALIPIAEKHADQIAGPRPGGDNEVWCAVWNRAFSKEMDRLSREEGLL